MTSLVRPAARRGPLRVLAALAVLLVVAAASATTAPATTPSRGVAASATARWSPAVCASVAEGIARQGLRAVLHYHPPLSYYPADTYLLLVRTGLAGFRRQGCRAAVLGRALVRHLARRQRAELLSHLPPEDARYLRRALAAA